MAETFAALLLAHVLGDFVLQTNAMVAGKSARSFGAFVAHLAIVAGLLALVLRPTTPEAVAVIALLTLAHGAIDLTKTYAPEGRLWTFLADQAAHLATLGCAAAIAPGLWAAGFGASALPLWLPGAITLVTGAVLATRAGGMALGLLMRPWAGVALDGLPSGGRIIGVLERGLIFLLIVTHTPEAIGFLIAAKSVLRFGAVKEEAKLSEYVIIGTLASFGWAITVALATVMLLSLLSPLGIPDLSP